MNWTPLLKKLPAAVQSVADTHDTPSRVSLILAITWTDQAVPYHRSANPAPTAVHAADKVQETPWSGLYVGPLGLGVTWMVQAEPFHASASVTGAEPVAEAPTAVQAVADAHETWLSTLVVAPAGLGVAWTDQL